MFKTVAQRLPWRLVAHRPLKWGRKEAHSSPGSQNGCTKVSQWSPHKRRCSNVFNLSDASASPVPPVCLRWLTNSVHWAITLVTTVPPFGDHGNPCATMAMGLPPLCLFRVTCCASTAVLMAHGRQRGCSVAITQKQEFLGLGNQWVYWSFFWSFKVAQRLQPCL